MSWERWRADNQAGWDNRVDIHTGPDGYDIAGLLGDPTRLSPTVENDRQALGALKGIDVVHLQCHLGTDTLSLLRLGAQSVTGLDFSSKGIAHCRSLFLRADAAGHFVQGDVYDAAALLGDRFDLVYASVGAINWIPSIARWMAVAAELLRPGGRLYLRDVHPMSMVIDPETDLELRLRYPYGEMPQPVTLNDEQTYAGDGTPLEHTTTHEWSHGLGEIVQGALDAGLRIDGLQEHYYTEWQMLPSMVRRAPGHYVLPERPERLPLLFTLRASKDKRCGHAYQSAYGPKSTSAPRMSNFDVRTASHEDRLPIQRMLELYQHDLSDIWDQDLDCHGEYGYALDRYWEREGCHPFVAVTNGKYAGFALVDQSVRLGTEGYWMDQFFVLKKYRRQGIGQLLANAVFAALPGRWEVGQMPQNEAAQAFWRKVIGRYTGGRFKEQEIRAGWWQGVIQVFESPANDDANSVGWLSAARTGRRPTQ